MDIARVPRLKSSRPGFTRLAVTVCAPLILSALVAATAQAASTYSINFDNNTAPGWTSASASGVQTWTASGGTYNNDNQNINWSYSVYGGATWATDYTYSVDLTGHWTSGDANLVGAVYNYTSASDYYVAAFNFKGRGHLYHVVNGTPTDLIGTVATIGYDTSAATIPLGSPFTVKIVRSGTTTSVYAAGVEVVTNFSQPTITTAGQVGVWIEYNQANFDNVAVTGSRDPYQQPFASTSIWNLPIAKAAVYKPAGLTKHATRLATETDTTNNPTPDVWADIPQLEPEHILLDATAPKIPLNYNTAGWSGADRCANVIDPNTNAPETQVSYNIPVPADYIVVSDKSNSGAAIIIPGTTSIIQTQPFARCQDANGVAYAWSNSNLVVTEPHTTNNTADLYGAGRFGAHGGSFLSTLGGTIRLGELRPNQQGPRHALKLVIDSPAFLFKCVRSDKTDCWRWPAYGADSFALSTYGTKQDPNSPNPAYMVMGSLLAIPASVNLSSVGLQTEPGRELAWTLQNYGAYIVDGRSGPGINIAIEEGTPVAARSKSQEFYNDYGYTMDNRGRNDMLTEYNGQYASLYKAWAADWDVIIQLLSVVDNNTETTPGGDVPGAPDSARLQPLAAPLQ